MTRDDMKNANKKILKVSKITTLLFMLVWLLTACEKELSQEEKNAIIYNVEILAQNNDAYKLSENVLDLCAHQAEIFRRANKSIVLRNAKLFIESNVSDSVSKKKMLSELSAYTNIYCTPKDRKDGFLLNTSDVRKNNKWFNDLIMYLNDVYTDSQFLTSEFFYVIQDVSLREQFISNAEKIANYNHVAGIAKTQKSKVYNKIMNDCIAEYKKQRE